MFVLTGNGDPRMVTGAYVSDGEHGAVAAGIATRYPARTPAPKPKYLTMVQLLLEMGANVDAVDLNGETAVHGAAYKNLPRVVKVLVASGAKIDVWNRPNKFRVDPVGHRGRLPVWKFQAFRRNRIGGA